MAVSQTKPSAAAVAGVARRAKALEILGESLKVDPQMLLTILKNQIMPNATDDEVAAIVIICNVYDLNPILREIYAFPDPKRKRIVPVVGVDGWAKIVNRQDDYDGCEFDWQFTEKGDPIACTCKLYHKKRSHPIVVTEYLDECKRNTDPWNNMTKRMLRHKAFIQAVRLAFGVSGIYDEDEARDIVVTDAKVTTAPAFLTPPELLVSRPQEPEPERQIEDTEAKAEEPERLTAGELKAQEDPLAEPPKDKCADLEGKQLLDLLYQLMKKDDVSEDQVVAYCRALKPPLAKPSQKELPELADSKLRTLINGWEQIAPEAKKVQV